MCIKYFLLVSSTLQDDLFKDHGKKLKQALFSSYLGKQWNSWVDAGKGRKSKLSLFLNLSRCTFHKLMAHKDICRNIYFWAILTSHNLKQSVCFSQICKSVPAIVCLFDYTAEAALVEPPWEGRPNLGNALRFGLRPFAQITCGPTTLFLPFQFSASDGSGHFTEEWLRRSY